MLNLFGNYYIMKQTGFYLRNQASFQFDFDHITAELNLSNASLNSFYLSPGFLTLITVILFYFHPSL